MNWDESLSEHESLELEDSDKLLPVDDITFCQVVEQKLEPRSINSLW